MAFSAIPISTGSATSQELTIQQKHPPVPAELELAHEVVPEPPAPLRLVPGETTVTAGTEQPYKAVRDDQYGYEEDLTAQTDFTIDRLGTCTRNGAEVRCWATKAGKYTVTGILRDSNLSATATLTVVPGPTTALRLDPATAEIQAGASQSYTAIAVDQHGNETDLTAQTDFTITGPGPGECPRDQVGRVSCTASEVGDYTITGTLGPVSKVGGSREMLLAWDEET